MVSFTTQFERCDRVQFSSDKPSMAKQAFRDQCDINNIMKRYEKTGIVEHAKRFSGNYGDFTGAEDYQDALAKVAAADEAFMSLPASIRKRFNNNPGDYFDFANDPANRNELIDLKLLDAEKVVEKADSEPEIQTKI